MLLSPLRGLGDSCASLPTVETVGYFRYVPAGLAEVGDVPPPPLKRWAIFGVFLRDKLRLQEIQAAPVDGDSEVGRQSKANRTPTFLKSFRAAPYVRRYLPPGKERRECEAQLCQTLTATSEPAIWLASQTEMARDSDQPRTLGAVYAYRSQARLFLGNRKQFLMACRSHARRLGAKCWRVERFWNL